MNILLTPPNIEQESMYFPQTALDALSKLGNLTFNEFGRGITHEEMCSMIGNFDICLTHWGCPMFDEEVTARATRLKLIAHAAGSVAYIMKGCVYEKGITVCSANTVMARHVAEGVLAYILSSLRLIPYHNGCMKSKLLWERKSEESRSLIGAKVGLIGLGTVGMYVLDILKPFDVSVKVFDPYLKAGALANHPEARLCSLEEALAWGDVVSVHASMTPETFHMLNAEKLALIRDGALLVNTARGSVLDESALASALATGRFNAVLDVYEHEPLPLESSLRELENVILIPHMGGVTSKEQMTFAMIDEIQRFINGEPLQYEIPYEQFSRMTRIVG